ncbi:glycosyltransferase family 4 protein [Flavobacterium kingsejongi]|uniref:Glycoside hydrolase n=1 Tax=Flavobacterium kingsejongi TaxID=1678728 RepID=A0A2S1LNT3_9FLAO|nr:glycosyltransferase family 4 protein [Flavobacterium kingsejongi]AWG25394.1 glycoside hydrolase [Flavobacterium kingsejongi]
MKIAFLTPEYPHALTTKSGGIGTSIANLGKALAALGHEILVIVYGQKEDTEFMDQEVQVHAVKNIKMKGLSWYFTRKKIQNRINKLVQENKIDIVEAPDWTGITSFMKLQCPLVIRENGSDTYFCYLDNRKVKWINKLHERKALKNADGIISVSHFTGELTDALMGLKSDFTVIPNGIDARLFHKRNIQSSDTLAILYFGSLIRKKGLLELPAIFNQVIVQFPNATLKLIGKDVPDIISGNPSTWAMMQPLFSKEALKQVTYLGGVEYSEIKSHIEDAAVCVFPSFAEAFPVSWLEAMAMKKAIVASNIGWATEMITDGQTGFLVHPTDHHDFAAKIVRLLEEPELRFQFGESARKKIEEDFDNIVIARKSILLYESILNKRK